ncbi:MAG: two-component system, NarL family, sensor histidine kinase DesK [Actinomycetota bacterium]|nr:two-component system, NarL family, sensor histidine kinase DesK [Actinomycetota bacterium]
MRAVSTSAVTGTPDRWQWLRGKLGFAFGGAWLIYLTYPFSTAWAAPAGVGRDISLGAVLLFGAVYLFALAGLPRRRLAPIKGVWSRATWSLLFAELVLVAAMSVAAHESALAALVFVTVTAMFLLPTRPSLVVVAVLIVAGEVVPRLVPGWQALDGIGMQCALLAMAIKGYTVLLARNAELLLARRELADMAVGRERERMARDVHDILGHSLTVITVKADLASKLFAAGAPERAGIEIADVESLSRAALADVRATVSGLREVGLASELASARSALRAAGIEPGLPSAIAEVPERLRELFAWAVREGTTNVIRHSGADTCEITLTSGAVRVCDDGRGPRWSDEAPTGHGLVGLGERAAALGASVTVGRAPNGGFLLSVLAGQV